MSLKSKDKFDKYLIYLVIFYCFQKYDYLIGFYHAIISVEKEISFNYKIEFDLLYVSVLWFKFNRQEEFNRHSINKYIKEIINICTEILEKIDDFRFFHLEVLSAISLIERDRVDLLKTISNKLDINTLLKHCNYISNSIADKTNIYKYSYFLKKVQNNKAYLLALTGVPHNLDLAIEIMIKEFKFPDYEEGNIYIIDTYAYINYKLGDASTDGSKKLKYYNIALRWFKKAIKCKYGKRMKELIYNDIREIQKKMKNINREL